MTKTTSQKRRAATERRKAKKETMIMSRVATTADPIRRQRFAAQKVASIIGARLKDSTGPVRALAEVMALPNSTPLRFPTVDAPRSSVSGLQDQRTIVSAPTPYSDFTAGDNLIAFFGQPGRLALVYTGGVAASSSSARFIDGALSSNVSQAAKSIEVPGVSASIAPISEWLDPIGWIGGPHGATQTVGKVIDHTFTFMNIGDTLEVAANISGFIESVNMSVNLIIKRYNGPLDPIEDVQALRINISAGSASGSITWTNPTYAGYYAVYIDAFAAVGAASITAKALLFNLNKTNSAGSKWIQVSMADVDPQDSGDINMLEEARVNAASVLCTNISSVLNKQGQVNAARIRQVPFWKLTASMLGRAAEHYSGDASHGCYTFFEFSDVRSEFKNSNTPFAGSFDLDYNDYYHFIRLTNPAYETQPNSYALKFDTVLEFKTDIGRYPKGLAEYDYTALIKARQLINSQPIWFYENPTHAKQLYGLVKRLAAGAWNTGKKLAPLALTAAGMANPELAPLIQALKLVV